MPILEASKTKSVSGLTQLFTVQIQIKHFVNSEIQIKMPGNYVNETNRKRRNYTNKLFGSYTYKNKNIITEQIFTNYTNKRTY